MKMHLGIAFLTGALLAGCGKQSDKSKSSTNTTTTSSGNPITAPVDYLGAVGKAQVTATRTLDVVNVSQAIKLFETSEERLPKNLNELVEKGYLPKLPTPPAGMKFDYNPGTGQVKVVPAQ